MSLAAGRWGRSDTASPLPEEGDSYYVRISPHIRPSIHLLSRPLRALDPVIASVAWRSHPLLPLAACGSVRGPRCDPLVRSPSHAVRISPRIRPSRHLLARPLHAW